MGDAWHNNHHNNLAKPTTKEQWWELDPVMTVAKIVSK
jgi:fatty-acid desaturase